jgi:23S rRNA (uridine2552-2'-O)-methyltransferase
MSRRKLSDRNSRRDSYHKRAKKQGFASRAIFKLEEVDRRFGLLSPGDRVLDLGCAPGSWLQYARTRVGDRGALVGIDRFELAAGIPGARLLVGDVFEVTPETLVGDLDAFDVVLSDMAPDTTGIRHVDQTRSEVLFERALEIAEQTLAPGGKFVGKLFQGPEFQTLIARCRAGFDAVKIVKPSGSRTRSIEQYVCARGYRGRQE